MQIYLFFKKKVFLKRKKSVAFCLLLVGVFFNLFVFPKIV